MLHNALAAGEYAEEGWRVRKDGSLFDRQLTHMTRLVDDLLDAGRISTGKARVSSSPVVVQEVVQRPLKGRGRKRTASPKRCTCKCLPNR